MWLVTVLMKSGEWRRGEEWAEYPSAALIQLIGDGKIARESVEAVFITKAFVAQAMEGI